MWEGPPPLREGGNPETYGNVKKSRGTTGSEEPSRASSPHSAFERTHPPAPESKKMSTGIAHQRGVGGGGAGEAALMPKKWGGKEAEASVEPGGPRVAAQVSGFRGAGNNS
jgi:hypothetical protein